MLASILFGLLIQIAPAEDFDRSDQLTLIEETRSAHSDRMATESFYIEPPRPCPQPGIDDPIFPKPRRETANHELESKSRFK